MIVISQSNSCALLLSHIVTNHAEQIIIKKGAHISVYNDLDVSEQNIEFVIEDYAQLQLFHHQWQTCHYARINNNFILGYKSKLTHTFLAIGAHKAEISVNLVLQKPYAQADLFGAYALADKQECTISTTQEHQAPNSISNLVYKGLLADSAVAHYKGLITIGAQARGSDANQQNKNLLLHPNARATSIPSLQALTNDIACKHGSAVGQLNAQHLWYLQSRGISYADARNLLMKAFLFDALRGITDEKLMQQIQEQMVKKV